MAASKGKPGGKAPPKRKKVSGPSQPEAERKNKLFALRLTPELRATVEAKAEAWGVGLGPALVRLVEAGLAAEGHRWPGTHTDDELAAAVQDHLKSEKAVTKGTRPNRTAARVARGAP